MAGKHPDDGVWGEVTKGEPVARWDHYPISNVEIKRQVAPVGARDVARRRSRLNEDQLLADTMRMVGSRLSRCYLEEPEEAPRDKRQGSEFGDNEGSTRISMDRHGAKLHRAVIPRHHVTVPLRPTCRRTSHRGSSADIPTIRAPVFRATSRTESERRREPRSRASSRQRCRAGWVHPTCHGFPRNDRW